MKLSHRRHGSLLLFRFFTPTLILLSGSTLGIGQICFNYVDTQNALAPILCVDKGTLSPPCFPPTDCTSILNPAAQTMLLMHTEWHDCFGNTLSPWTDPMTGAVSQPEGRGLRWYAFHRQFEHDYNIWRETIAFPKIESLNWCEDMIMPLGHPDAAPGGIGHVAGCGDGNPRPAVHTSGSLMGQPVRCSFCEAFPPCLFFQGMGPNCGSETGNSAHCVVGSTTYTALEQFANVDDLSEVLDDYFHGTMHGAVGLADSLVAGTTYVNDASNPNCSPRDPMFWRLHKALDDIVRAWQDHTAVDIMLVLDKSGSMSQPDSGGMSKLDAAVDAARMFADILDHTRTDGQVNRIGIATFSSSSTLDLALTDANTSLLNPGGPLDSALNAISAAGPGGSTAMGQGLQEALDQLCGGDCDGYIPSAGENSRKAILLLTDGRENVAPCLGGDFCSGTDFDRTKLDITQLCSVGFGNSGSLDGELLTLLSESQGGIYMQNPASAIGDDLKKFFVMAYGQLTDEFLLADPHGVLPANVAATEPVIQNVCGDSKITFTSGWKIPVSPGDLRLIVTAPSGDLVPTSAPDIQSNVRASYDYKRVPLPFRGETTGNWRAHLIRPHRAFVNGFTTDAIEDTERGVVLVRRQIQRLCPDGAGRVLYFEDGRIGPDSIYERALEMEVASSLIADLKSTDSADEFSELLVEDWDLIVYAHQRGEDVGEPYDQLFQAKLCEGQKAIITENRLENGAQIHRCAGALVEPEGDNYRVLLGDTRLFGGTMRLVNHGYDRFSWNVQPAGIATIQATGDQPHLGAILANTDRGIEHHWFIGILGRGASKLDPHLQFSHRQTGDDLVATVRVLPSYQPIGGYDSVHARVEVTYPTESLGNIFTEQLSDNLQINGEGIDRRMATVTGTNQVVIPTNTEIFPLNDDGKNGDQHPNNYYWTGILPDLGRHEGMYQLRFIVDFTKNGCTTRREMVRSVFIDAKADPMNTTVEIRDSRPLQNGRLTNVRLTPRDAFQNMWGPGRVPEVTCGATNSCEIQEIRDNGDGSYDLMVLTQGEVPGVRLQAFNSFVDVPVVCDGCPNLSLLRIDPMEIEEFQTARVTVALSGPAPPTPSGGAVVYLRSSNPTVFQVPESIVIPAGQMFGSFVVDNAHDHNQVTNMVSVVARYGTEIRQNRVTLLPRRLPAPVPFEITSIRDMGEFLQIDFSSPYTMERHELDSRPNLDDVEDWLPTAAALSQNTTNNYRLMAQRSNDPEQYVRVRAVFDHSHGAEQISRTTQVIQFR